MKRLAALSLAFALLLTPALAVEDPSLTRQEDLEFLCSTLAETHPGFDVLVDQEAFAAKRAEIEARIPTASDQEFALDLQSLVALLGDSHTTTNLSSVLSSSPLYPISLGWYDGAWILQTAPAEQEALLGWEVTAVNGLPMEEVLARMAALVSADNPVKLRRQTQQVFPSQAVLAYLGLAEPEQALTLTLRRQEQERAISVKALTPEAFEALGSNALARLSDRRAGTAPTTRDGSRAYFSLSLSDSAYYIQYNTCREDPELPMETFAAQAAEEWAAGGYDTLLIDLRYNGGGSDGVLYPILEWASDLVREGHTVYALIGEATFSSAIINAVELKELGAVLAGSPTSGSADHYGSTRSFSLPNSGVRVSCSTKFIDLETLFESGVSLGIETLRPDLAVEQTLDDLLAGEDTLVNAILALERPYSAPAAPDAPLTRGGFARLLWASAGSPEAETCPFADVFPPSQSVPAIAWCAQEGVAQGDEAGAFSAARPITLQEAAVMLHRLAGSPAAESNPTAAPWATQAMGWLARQGALPQGTAPGDPLTQAQGEALLALLS